MKGKDIRCPYCGSEIETILEYTGHSYSEHRDHTGFECESFKCLAEWDHRGNLRRPPHPQTPSLR